MPKGGKLDRTHKAIARSVGGPNASGKAWAIMKSRGMAKQKGRHIVGTRRLYRRKRK